jgi:hypothetical protein
MSNKKISQLDSIGTIDVNQDSIPIVDYSENVTKRTNLANIGQRVLEASTTTNLAEGTNLYFTNTRVYTKAKAAFKAGSNTSITFDDALQTITIASQGNVQSVNTKTGAVVLTTTDISEGTNEYFTAARVRAVVLTGISLVTNAVISATDTVLSAFGKLQAQITANLSTLTSHTSNTSNPHATTKAQVGLGNADNTSDANKPVSTATQTALNAKQDTLVSNTNIKTVNSTTLLGSGDIAVQPTLVSGTSIKTVNSNSLLGAGDVAVQPTLVSGTNIKTLNSVSLLGSGDIVLAATPSGISGAIQFSDGSAFASDATKFFWDNTNKRFGVGTNAPSAIIHSVGSVTASGLIARGNYLNNTLVASANNDVLVGLDVQPTFSVGAFTGVTRYGIRTNSEITTQTFKTTGGNTIYFNSTSGTFGADGTLSLIGFGGVIIGFTNSASRSGIFLGAATGIGFYANAVEVGRIFNGGNFSIGTTTDAGYKLDVNGTVRIQNKLSVGTPTQASAVMEITSTTLGFLPPRMTTTQKNAITSPATGLMVYDTTLNLISVYNGTMWISL